MKTPRLIFLSAGGLFSGSDASGSRELSPRDVFSRLRDLRGSVDERELQPLRRLALEVGAASLTARMARQSGYTPSRPSDKSEFHF